MLAFAVPPCWVQTVSSLRHRHRKAGWWVRRDGGRASVCEALT